MPLEPRVLSRSVLRTGVELHHAESGTGQPLVFIHGGFGDWRSWAPQWDAFEPHFRCITYSRRYSTPNRNPIASETHDVFGEAEDLQALLDTCLANPAILVGTSYGAYTALALALKAAHKVRALVLAEPPLVRWADRSPGGLEARQRFERDVLLAARHAFERGESKTAVTLLTEGINGTLPGTSAITPEGLARRLENAPAMRALLASRDPFPQLDAARIRRLDKPTLLIAGEHTEPIHDAIFRALCGVMTQACQVRIPGCGHGAHRDNPRAFNDAVLTFLRDSCLL